MIAPKSEAPTVRDLSPNRRELVLFAFAIACATLSTLLGAFSLIILQPFVDNVLTLREYATGIPLVLKFLGLTVGASIFYF
ncbi:MAG: hypothetical protein ACREJQ_05020, partial [bacterium]